MKAVILLLILRVVAGEPTTNIPSVQLSLSPFYEWLYRVNLSPVNPAVAITSHHHHNHMGKVRSYLQIN